VLNNTFYRTDRSTICSLTPVAWSAGVADSTERDNLVWLPEGHQFVGSPQNYCQADALRFPAPARADHNVGLVTGRCPARLTCLRGTLLGSDPAGSDYLRPAGGGPLAGKGSGGGPFVDFDRGWATGAEPGAVGAGSGPA
jgi:hypothetical protein